VFDDGANLVVRSGRAAIALCLQLIGVRPGDEVLLPSYHCGSMVEPIIWAGATPLFFRVDRRLHANLDDITRALRRRPRALLLTHFFGFAQPLREVRELCKANGVVLIEDCAHAYFGQSDQGLPLGSVGDFAIASLPKFFPTAGGGLLRINDPEQRARFARLRRRSGLRYELRACVEPHERAVRYGRGSALSHGLARLAGLRRPALNGHAAPREQAQGEPLPVAAAGPAFRYLIPSDIAQPGAICTERQWRRADRDALAAARIRNWHTLARGLAPLGRNTLFATTLPAGVVPYKFALIIEDTEECFPALKRRGVPLWRWEDLAISPCEVADDYRLRLLQIPCHQSLTEADMTWIVEQFQAVLGRRAAPEMPARPPLRMAQ
jgi:dTDP-4-amino-4,6-dideoxygalactose transaminase